MTRNEWFAAIFWTVCFIILADVFLVWLLPVEW